MSLESDTQMTQDVGEASTLNREEEYRRAQISGTEAIMVGRETLETVVRQGEQLQRAEHMADDTVYTAEYANRLLRGMTWSGWLANKFSKPITCPEYRNQNVEASQESKRILKPLKQYETVPEVCIDATQSVQNYHLNLQVLEDCETEEQKETCRLICDNMYRQAILKIAEILKESERNDNESSSEEENNYKDFASQLSEDLSCLRQRQFVLQQLSRGVSKTATSGDQKAKLFDSNAKKNEEQELSVSDKVIAQQEQHLNIMGDQIRELGYLASNISISAQQHAEMVDSLNTKSDDLYFKMNTMNRRTEQLIKNKSWGKHKSEFAYYASIRHLTSGRYLSVDANNDSTLVLSNALNERCIFGIYKRRRFLGLQNKFNRKWVGQNMFGQINCSASSFDRRQEWDTDGDDWSDTTLLSVSAGWGAGGYLLFDEEGKGTPTIGGGDLATKTKAPKWCISEFHET